jgi:arylsulfatase A-like enzyme
MSLLRAIAVASLAWTAAVACRPAPDAPPPNLLLVTFDTTRADHTSVGGYARDTTPRLRRLAEQGANFAIAYSTTASTAPAHASLFTSLYPREHGLDRNSLVLDPDVETLAELLAARGFQTAGIPSSYVLDSEFGVAQGFERWDDHFELEESMVELRGKDGAERKASLDRRADFTTDRAIAWLGGRETARPFFLFVHYMDPHAPYEPPPPFDARFAGDAVSQRAPTEVRRKAVNAYDGEIAYADEQLGRLVDQLDALGLAERTIVVVTADHGEGLQEHGVWLHTVNVHEEQVRVPLVFRWTGRIAPGRVVSEPVSIVDVVPTLLDLMGLAAGATPPSGRSLAAALRDGARVEAGAPVFFQRRNYERAELVEGLRVLGAQHGVRAGRWKWIEGDRDGTRQLYDLETDEAETLNRALEEPQRAQELAALVAQWRERHAPKFEKARPLTPEEVEKLRALGYGH